MKMPLGADSVNNASMHSWEKTKPFALLSADILRKSLIILIAVMFLAGTNLSAWAEDLGIAGLVFEDANRNSAFDAGEKPLQGVVVSDGRSVSVTNDEGRYGIQTAADRIVFVSVPGSHHAPGNRFYRRLDSLRGANPPSDAGSDWKDSTYGIQSIPPPNPQRIDFPLVKNADTGDNESFTFVFVTDTHVTQKHRGEEGVRKAYQAVKDLNPALVVHGGDIVFDVLKVSDKKEAQELYELYKNKLAPIVKAPFYHTLGNHDVFGWAGLPDSEPVPRVYGKKLYNDYFGPTYYSFNYKHCHFVVLDSIGRTKNISGNTTYYGTVDATQREWLRRDLSQVGASTPIILISHIPTINALASYFGQRSEVVLTPEGEQTPKHQIFGFQQLLGETLKGNNLKLALAGHYHTYEKVHWKSNEHNADFVVGGAICGEWWKGDHRVGYSSWPEGFTLIRVDGERFDVSYISYDWEGIKER